MQGQRSEVDLPVCLILIFDQLVFLAEFFNLVCQHLCLQFLHMLVAWKRMIPYLSEMRHCNFTRGSVRPSICPLRFFKYHADDASSFPPGLVLSCIPQDFTAGFVQPSISWSVGRSHSTFFYDFHSFLMFWPHFFPKDPVT